MADIGEPPQEPPYDRAVVNEAAEAECMHCGVDAVQRVLRRVAALHEGMLERSVLGWACQPCIDFMELERSIEFRYDHPYQFPSDNSHKACAKCGAPYGDRRHET